ncbi:MAG: U32 family peptidase [Lachnospiraceae bacterium]|nr:U32 family peptidase [Lachnospiraceae bacterium]
MKKVELLAPAGNYESFLGAICAGADAVYLAGRKFGARAYADNFSDEEILQAIRIAHLMNKKIYLTINTLVKEFELSDLLPFVTPFAEAGLDGVIIQDFGVFQVLRENFPKLELHASTQMTITGSLGAAFMKEQGACRIVPARELSLAEIKQIKTEVPIEIEAFIHGAMCYAYSGQCLFSSILGGRSGNRGRCAQPCRLPYKVDGKKEQYPLSLKDMCTVQAIPELIRAGIDSFKIEGRMKKPEYAAGITAIYRKYIDAYYAAPDKPLQISREDLDILQQLYIRTELQDGYYFRHNGREMVTIGKPSYSGCEDGLLERIRKEYLNRLPKRDVYIEVSAFTGCEITCTMTLCDEPEKTVTVMGTVVDAAQKTPLSESKIKEQIGRLGDSVFQAGEITVYTDEHSFLPVSALNNLRREAVGELEKLILQKENVKTEIFKTHDLMQNSNNEVMQSVQLTLKTTDQLKAFMTFTADSQQSYEDKIFPFIAAEILTDKASAKIDLPKSFGICLPEIIRMKDDAFLEQLKKFCIQTKNCKAVLVRSLEGMQWLKKLQMELTEENRAIIAVLDSSVYVWNHKAWIFLKQCGLGNSRFTIPYELNKKETLQLMAAVKQYDNKIFFSQSVYGRIPLMYTANCLKKTSMQCDHQQSVVTMEDRYHVSFPVVTECSHCYNIVYNSVPLALHGVLSEIENRVSAIRLDFTIEGEYETNQILSYFLGLWIGKQKTDVKPPLGDYTTGHYKRGVE